jgi:ubiquitin C-terminal hydrolase
MYQTSFDVLKAVMAGGANNELRGLVFPSSFIPLPKGLFPSPRSSHNTNPIVVGLRNIGNSCFLNAVVQVRILNRNQTHNTK